MYAHKMHRFERCSAPIQHKRTMTAGIVEQGLARAGTGRGLRNSPAEGKDNRAPARLTAQQRHALEYRDD